ncbi:Hypothetical predicted protein [Mytilus galloprovincialis]|uniref:Uncharacterized protein n=1 Tax=Mytilus galloprovincialis TaxID=29158 RepID=A0A8B6FY31_MYTGA|nr:Hypothetical predicted protein [Mytilus galloprovincialis]
MLENNYSNTSVQKGGVPGVQGCLEHTSVLTKTIQEVKAKTGDLTVMCSNGSTSRISRSDEQRVRNVIWGQSATNKSIYGWHDKITAKSDSGRIGRKWVTKSAIEDVESRFRHRDIVALVTSGEDDLVLATFSNHYGKCRQEVSRGTRLEESHERKLTKYQELVLTDVKEKNWGT